MGTLLRWDCTRCEKPVGGTSTPRSCPNCGYTVYRPVFIVDSDQELAKMIEQGESLEQPEKSPKSLSAMEEEVFQVNEANGWYHGDRSFGDGIALLHSEVSEALEAYRNWGTDDATAYGPNCPCPDELLSGDRSNCTCTPPKPEGVGSEFADVLIRLLDLCREWKIDLQAEYERKISHNKVRGYRHGGKRL